MKLDGMARKLGYADYAEYLRSDHWADFRRRYFSDPRTTHRCSVCRRRGGVRCLHHVSYDRLGAEEFSDVIPACRGCHDRIHRWLKDHGKGVSRTGEAIAALKPRADARKNRRKRKRKRRRDRPPVKFWLDELADRKMADPGA